MFEFACVCGCGCVFEWFLGFNGMACCYGFWVHVVSYFHRQAGRQAAQSRQDTDRFGDFGDWLVRGGGGARQAEQQRYQIQSKIEIVSERERQAHTSTHMYQFGCVLLVVDLINCINFGILLIVVDLLLLCCCCVVESC